MKLRSMRIARLFHRSAWKRIYNFPSLFMIAFGVIMGALLYIFGGDDISTKILSICVLWIFVYAFVIVLTADDFFIVRFGEEKCKVYVYACEKGFIIDKYEIWIKTKEGWLVKNVFNYNRNIYGKRAGSFIYWPADDNELNVWWLINRRKNEPQLLGKRIGEHIFVLPERQNKKIILNVLNQNGFVTYKADEYVCNQVYIPKESWSEIKTAGGIALTQLPDEYFVIRNNGQYSIFAIWKQDAENPVVCRLCVPWLFFKKGRRLVVLQDDVEIASTDTVLKNPSPTAIEFLNPKVYGGMSVQISRFDMDKKMFYPVYSGPICAVDFVNGDVITADGREIRPKANNLVNL